MNIPYLISAVPTVSIRFSKFMPPIITPIIGIMISSTKEFTILVNAPPITTATARSITLPLEINSLNSFIKPFISCFSYFYFLIRRLDTNHGAGRPSFGSDQPC